MTETGRDMSQEARPLWTFKEVSEALGVPSQAEWQAQGVSIDTRTLSHGDIFVAIRGDRLDGHDYVSNAFENGAAVAIVAADAKLNDIKGLDETHLLHVTDTQEALERLGQAARNRMSGKVIAVTGSVGKTTVKEGLGLVFSQIGKTHISQASYNNLWGVPLSLARMPADTEIGVFEIGMNHAGEISPLTRQVRPDIAVITKIANAHIEHFDTLEGIARAKAEIFEGLGGLKTALVPADSEWAALLTQSAKDVGARRVVSFGESDTCDARVISFKLHDHCSCVSAEILGQSVTFRIGAPGHHQIVNAMSILATVQVLEEDLTSAVLSLGEMKAMDGRGRLHNISLSDGELIVIDESYNANPESIVAALKTLGQFPRLGQGRRIAVLGDMKELGGQSDALHKSLVEHIVNTDVDIVFTVGAQMKLLQDALPGGRRGAHATSVDGLISLLKREVHAGDAVMVKGSNSMRLSELVKCLVDLDVKQGFGAPIVQNERGMS